MTFEALDPAPRFAQLAADNADGAAFREMSAPMDELEGADAAFRAIAGRQRG